MQRPLRSWNVAAPMVVFLAGPIIVVLLGLLGAVVGMPFKLMDVLPLGVIVGLVASVAVILRILVGYIANKYRLLEAMPSAIAFGTAVGLGIGICLAGGLLLAGLEDMVFFLGFPLSFAILSWSSAPGQQVPTLFLAVIPALNASLLGAATGLAIAIDRRIEPKRPVRWWHVLIVMLCMMLCLSAVVSSFLPGQ